MNVKAAIRLLCLIVVVLLAVSPWLVGRVAAQGDGCPEPNDSFEQACDAPRGRKVFTELGVGNDVDRFRLKVADGQSIEIALNSAAGLQRMSLDAADGTPVADAAMSKHRRVILAERLPAGDYILSVEGEYPDPGASRAYDIEWKAVGDGPPLPITLVNGAAPRDIALTLDEVGERATHSWSRLLAARNGRIYEAMYEREDTVQARKHGPQQVLSRIYIGTDAGVAREIFAEWNVFDLPEAYEYKHDFEFLGEQPMPRFGEEFRALGACAKCNDGENPRRQLRVLSRQGANVVLLYTWGRDAGNNEFTVADLFGKIMRKL